MFVLAAGNLFTGSFNYASMTGTVKFGSKYTYTARPKALRVNITPRPATSTSCDRKIRPPVWPRAILTNAVSSWRSWTGPSPTRSFREPARPREPGIRPTERTSYRKQVKSSATARCGSIKAPRRCLGFFRRRTQNPLVRRESSGSHRELHDRDLMRRECLRRLHDGLLESLPLCR